jgi:hypothetical protein
MGIQSMKMIGRTVDFDAYGAQILEGSGNIGKQFRFDIGGDEILPMSGRENQVDQKRDKRVGHSYVFLLAHITGQLSFLRKKYKTPDGV